MTGYRTVIESLIALHEVPTDRFRDDRAIGLPAHRVTPQLAESVLREIAQERGMNLGPITDAFDARIHKIDGRPFNPIQLYRDTMKIVKANFSDVMSIATESYATLELKA